MKHEPPQMSTRATPRCQWAERLIDPPCGKPATYAHRAGAYFCTAHAMKHPSWNKTGVINLIPRKKP